MFRSMTYDAIISVMLGEVATISAGHPLRGSIEALGDGEVSFIQLKNVDPASGVDWASVTHVDLASARTPKWLNASDVIFSARGSRNYAYALTDAPKHSVCSPHFFVLNVKDPNAVVPEFLAWQLNQRPAQEYFKRTAVGTQAVTTVRRPALEAFPVLVPPINEQKLIVEFSKAARQEQIALQHLIANRTQQSDAIAYGLQTRAKEARA